MRCLSATRTRVVRRRRSGVVHRREFHPAWCPRQRESEKFPPLRRILDAHRPYTRPRRQRTLAARRLPAQGRVPGRSRNGSRAARFRTEKLGRGRTSLRRGAEPVSRLAVRTAGRLLPRRQPLFRFARPQRTRQHCENPGRKISGRRVAIEIDPVGRPLGKQ